MPASTVPSFIIQPENKAHITISQTNAYLTDQSETYNQAGFSFNQAGIEYGGVSNFNQDIVPALSQAIQVIARMKIPTTTATFFDQGYIYNQANFSFNQASVDFAGLSNQNQDIVPSVLTATLVVPHNYFITDIYTQGSITPSSGRSGPGWFMYINLT